MLYGKASGKGEPVYLMHGWALNHRVWDPVIDELSRQWAVTAIDLPGHGKSPPLDSEYSLDAMTDMLATAILPGSRIIGWSLGGMIATSLAYRYPHLVKQLVLVASSPRFTQCDDWPCAVEPAVINGFAADLRKDYHATILRFLTLQTLGSQHGKSVVRNLRDKLFLHGEPHIDTLSKGLHLLNIADLRHAATMLQCPTLIVLGEKDTMVPACSGKYTRKLIANSKVSIIAGAGHAPFISHPHAFLEIVTEFLRDNKS